MFFPEKQDGGSSSTITASGGILIAARFEMC